MMKFIYHLFFYLYSQDGEETLLPLPVWILMTIKVDEWYAKVTHHQLITFELQSIYYLLRGLIGAMRANYH